jgi:hypothetical protein
MQTDESGAPWPYDTLEHPPLGPTHQPTWEGPEGICICCERPGGADCPDLRLDLQGVTPAGVPPPWWPDYPRGPG